MQLLISIHNDINKKKIFLEKAYAFFPTIFFTPDKYSNGIFFYKIIQSYIQLFEIKANTFQRLFITICFCKIFLFSKIVNFKLDITIKFKKILDFSN